MSEENVEIVRAGIAAYNRGNLDTVVEMCDPEMVFETLLSGTHRGKEALRVIYEENQKTLSGHTLDSEELIDLGDKVIAVVQIGGAGPVSQISLDDRIAVVFAIKDGLMVRLQVFRNKEEALEVAGLRE
jgi:ketosteroid isomerase-like protein